MDFTYTSRNGSKYQIEVNPDYFDCPDENNIQIFNELGLEVTSESKVYSLILDAMENIRFAREMT